MARHESTIREALQKYFDDAEARNLAKSTVAKLPFDEHDIKRTVEAADKLPEWGSFGPRLKAMVLLLRHSGLRLQDAACLERTRVNGDQLFLYTQKTDTPVSCPLPPEVVKALERVGNERPEYFFWDGKSERVLLAGAWMGIRQQLAISDAQFLRSMIPHHSGAILMCQRATITDPEITRLCATIIAGQQEEIDQMIAALRRLSK